MYCIRKIYAKTNPALHSDAIALLHTWDQKLRDHFHLHCLVPAGALCDDKTRWKPCNGGFLFHVKALSIVFREKYLDYVEAAYKRNELIFPGQTKAIGSPRGFKDLMNRCYTNRWVAISNNRILSCDNGKVCFTYKHRKSGQSEQATVDAVEFIRRFLLHVLPKRFMRIRHYGFLSNRNKKHNVQICTKLLGQCDQLPEAVSESIEQIMLRLTGVDITRCPRCKKGNADRSGQDTPRQRF